MESKAGSSAATMGGDVVLDVQGIHVYYGQVHALKGVSLTIHRGEIVTLIGANGAGKSTTLSAISGLASHALARSSTRAAI